jgi:hypothetical protein
MQFSEPHANSNMATLTDVPEEPFLPSYEAAVGALDSTKLPSYRRTFSARFHPYKRPTMKNVDERDRFSVSPAFLIHTFRPPPKIVVVFVSLVRY